MKYPAPVVSQLNPGEAAVHSVDGARSGGIALDDFCRWLMNGGIRASRLQPASIAREFVDYFGISAFPRMEELKALLGQVGIRVVVRRLETGGLRGFHTGTRDGDYCIVIDADDWEGAQAHTMLHEAYEIIRERLADLYPRVGIPKGKAICRQADKFAASALMQPRWFALFAEVSGFDVVALHQVYGRAYSSLTIRLAEVMNNQSLLAVLYERKEPGGPDRWKPVPSPEDFRATVVARTPGFRLRTVKKPMRYLRGYLPRRGAPPAQCSVAERVILTGRPAFVERVSGYDLWHADDVTVAARPVFWYGKLARVSLVAVPHWDRSVLKPQLSQATFERIPHAHQVL